MQEADRLSCRAYRRSTPRRWAWTDTGTSASAAGVRAPSAASTCLARRIVITGRRPSGAARQQLARSALIDAGDEIPTPDLQLPVQPPLRHGGAGRGGAYSHHGRGAFSASAAIEAAHGGTRVACCWPVVEPHGYVDRPPNGRIHEVVQARGGLTIIDEIYLARRRGLRPDGAGYRRQRHQHQ